MAYDPNSPAAAQLLSTSQPIIQGNFAILQNIFDINHVDYNSGTNAGKHIYVELPIAAGNPIPPIAFPAAEIAVYAATNATTAVNELYVNKTNQATVVQVPMTASTLSITSAPATNAGMWTYLPSGLLLKSGSSAGTLTGLVTVTPTGGPAFTRMLSVLVCPYNSTSSGDLNFAVRLVDINSATTFRIYISSRTTSGGASGQTGFQFFAIGVP